VIIPPPTLKRSISIGKPQQPWGFLLRYSLFCQLASLFVAVSFPVPIWGAQGKWFTFNLFLGLITRSLPFFTVISLLAGNSGALVCDPLPIVRA
jgi:hypothetical protein